MPNIFHHNSKKEMLRCLHYLNTEHIKQNEIFLCRSKREHIQFACRFPAIPCRLRRTNLHIYRSNKNSISCVGVGGGVQLVKNKTPSESNINRFSMNAVKFNRILICVRKNIENLPPFFILCSTRFKLKKKESLVEYTPCLFIPNAIQLFVGFCTFKQTY